jgi:hypothetical protein
MRIAAAPRTRPGGLEPLWWATRALRREILGFRFDYPVDTVPSAGPRDSLAYYVHSDRLFFDAMELDPRGIPVQRSRTVGPTHNPAYVAWYGLASLGRALQGRDLAGEGRFLAQVEWLAAHGVRREDDAVVWPYTFDWREGHCVLRAPWISAMAQGLAMSALVRGYRVTGREGFLDLCRAASRVFARDVRDGGVRTVEQGHALYEEYPGYPLPRVLDGFLFGLLGLYDLAAETGDHRAIQLFADGIKGLRHALPRWDYRGKWSWYGSHGYLCPPHYHRLNQSLLHVLGRLSREPILIRYAERWDPARLSVADRLEVFSAFLLTKNWARVRFRLPAG